MQLVEAVLIHNCMAQKMTSGRPEQMPITKGTKVTGSVEKVTLPDGNTILALITKDEFIIPEPFIHALGWVEDSSFDEAEIVEDKSEGVQDKSKVFKDAYKNIVASEMIAKDSLKSKRSVYFGMGGAALGLVYAMMKRHNKLLFASIGAFSGAMLGSYVSTKLNKDENKER